MKTASILKNLAYNEQRPAVSVMMETEFSKEIRIAFKQGQVLAEHQAPFPITVQIVKGNIDFGVQGEIHALETGDLITLSGKVPHDLTANEDCVVRLTLSKKDRADRVKSAAS